MITLLYFNCKINTFSLHHYMIKTVCSQTNLGGSVKILLITWAFIFSLLKCFNISNEN